MEIPSNHALCLTGRTASHHASARSSSMRETEQKMDDYNVTSFTTTPGFCPDCGSILPLLGDTGGVTCCACKRKWGPEVFGDMAMSHTLYFNAKETYTFTKNKDDDKENANGPIVERLCPQCQNDKMSYATLQLRSADEGQTVFYTCTKCKFKETENS